MSLRKQSGPQKNRAQKYSGITHTTHPDAPRHLCRTLGSAQTRDHTLSRTRHLHTAVLTSHAHTPMRARPFLKCLSAVESVTGTGLGKVGRARLPAAPGTTPPAQAETESGLRCAGVAWARTGGRSPGHPRRSLRTYREPAWARMRWRSPNSNPRRWHPPPTPPRAGLESHLYRPRAERGGRLKEAQQQQHQKADAPGPRPPEQRRPRHAAPASRAPDGRTGWQVRSAGASWRGCGVLRLRTPGIRPPLPPHPPPPTRRRRSLGELAAPPDLPSPWRCPKGKVKSWRLPWQSEGSCWGNRPYSYLGRQENRQEKWTQWSEMRVWSSSLFLGEEMDFSLFIR